MVRDGDQRISFPGDTPRATMKKALVGYFHDKYQEASRAPPSPQQPWLNDPIATEPQLVDALTRADAAGDITHARQIAEMIRQQRSMKKSASLSRVPTSRLNEMLKVALEADAEHVMGAYQPRSHLIAIWNMIALAISLPLALLALAATSLWVANGFTRQSG
jgi:hypothetical protein